MNSDLLHSEKVWLVNVAHNVDPPGLYCGLVFISPHITDIIQVLNNGTKIELPASALRLPVAGISYEMELPII